MVIAGIAMGVLALIAVIIALVSRRSRPATHFLDEEPSQHRSFAPLTSQELAKDVHKDGERKSFNSDASIDVKSLQKSVSAVRPPPPADRMQSFSDNQFVSRINNRRSTSVHAVAFALPDLQTATTNFATGRLLGEGTIGRVYKAKFADGRVILTFFLLHHSLLFFMSDALHHDLHN